MTVSEKAIWLVRNLDRYNRIQGMRDRATADGRYSVTNDDKALVEKFDRLKREVLISFTAESA